MEKMLKDLQKDAFERTAALQKEALDSATEHIRSQRHRLLNTRFIAGCLTALVIIALICATIIGVTAINRQHDLILEQQRAIQDQYESLMDYVKGAEIVTEETSYTVDSGDNGTAVFGEGNTVIGGDMVGKD